MSIPNYNLTPPILPFTTLHHHLSHCVLKRDPAEQCDYEGSYHLYYTWLMMNQTIRADTYP